MDCVRLQRLVMLWVLSVLIPSSGGNAIMSRDRALIRVKEAAELLEVSPNTIRAWGASGKIPEYRHPVNNYRLYKRNELEGLMKRLDESRKSMKASKRKRAN